MSFGICKAVIKVIFQFITLQYYTAYQAQINKAFQRKVNTVCIIFSVKQSNLRLIPRLISIEFKVH